MENDETLRKMHRLHLILADELKRICEKHKIRYFMIAGTLLGAVRHKGFIPWDDDMDFGMIRPDFERFLKVCENELDDKKFYLQTDKSEKYYAFNFAKLRLKGTKVMEKFSASVPVCSGIYIDIFPIDAVFDHKMKAEVQYASFWIVRNLLWVKCGYGSQERKKEFTYRIARFAAALLPVDFLKKMKHKAITMCCGKYSKRVVTSDGNYGLKKETLESKWVTKIEFYDFEDRRYPGISDYDAYLTYFYGDYMKLPPANSRNHHDRLEVDFGIYDRERESL